MRKKPLLDKPLRKKRKGSFALNPAQRESSFGAGYGDAVEYGESGFKPGARKFNTPAWEKYQAGFQLGLRAKKAHESARKIAKNPRPAPRKKPVPAAAARKVSRFADVPVSKIQHKTVDIPTPKGVALQIGRLLAVAYDTGTGLRGSKRVHRFAKSSQPMLIATDDGRRLFVVGGKFRFTERGIVDY